MEAFRLAPLYISSHTCAHSAVSSDGGPGVLRERHDFIAAVNNSPLRCAGAAGAAPRCSIPPQPGPAGGPAPRPQPRTGGPLPSAGGWAERGGANGSGRAAPGAGAAEPLGEQRGSERRGGRGRGRRGSRPCGAAGEARSRQPGALHGRRLGVNEAGEAGMAGVSYSPPWWVSLLHRLPHLSLRWELTAADFRPDDAEYQQVSAALRARCRGGAAPAGAAGLRPLRPRGGWGRLLVPTSPPRPGALRGRRVGVARGFGAARSAARLRWSRSRSLRARLSSRSGAAVAPRFISVPRPPGLVGWLHHFAFGSGSAPSWSCGRCCGKKAPAVEVRAVLRHAGRAVRGRSAAVRGDAGAERERDVPGAMLRNLFKPITGAEY